MLTLLNKGQGVTKQCNGYRSQKMLAHAMAVEERVFEENSIPKTIKLSEIQMGFMPQNNARYNGC